MGERGRRIVLGITDPQSAGLLVGLPRRLAADGWDVHLVAGAPVMVDHATVHVVPMRRNPALWRDTVGLVLWTQVLLKLRPSAVLIGTPKASLLGLVAAMLTRVPVRVYHLRGLRLETASGFARRGFVFLERIAMCAATQVLAVSPSLAQECARRGLAPRGKVLVLGLGSSNGVDHVAFAPAAGDGVQSEARALLGLVDDLPVVGFVGRLNEAKGVEVLVEAMGLLYDRLPVQLLLVGAEDQPGYARKLRSQLDAQRVPTVMAGSLPVDASVYYAMDVFCLPSLREGFPNVVLEAAASGTPVVTTKATGCRDAVVEGETGWLAKVGDAAELARCLEEALTDPTLSARYVESGRRRVVSAYARRDVQANIADHLWSITRPTDSTLRVRGGR